MTYGAFFVRSRITNAGPNEVELLWPASKPVAPRDRLQRVGLALERHVGDRAPRHLPANDQFIQQNLGGIDLRQWHTWGVIWTPTAITYTVDGKQWGYAAHDARARSRRSR